MKHIINNKRGDIPITILVMGVIVICMLAIVSFYISDIKVKNSFASVGIIGQAALLKEKAGFYENVGLNRNTIDSLVGIKTETLAGKQISYIELEQGKISVRYNEHG